MKIVVDKEKIEAKGSVSMRADKGHMHGVLIVR